MSTSPVYGSVTPPTLGTSSTDSMMKLKSPDPLHLAFVRKVMSKVYFTSVALKGTPSLHRTSVLRGTRMRVFGPCGPSRIVGLSAASSGSMVYSHHSGSTIPADSHCVSVQLIDHVYSVS